MRLLQWLDDAPNDVYVHFAPDAIDTPWDKLSYSDLANDVSRISNVLSMLNLERGSVVALVLSNPRDFIPAFFATLLQGATPCPLATPLTFTSSGKYISHLRNIFSVARPQAIIIDPYLADFISQAVMQAGITTQIIPLQWDNLPEPSHLVHKKLADHALLQFTSGSSGTPKAVQVTPENLDSNIAAITHWIIGGRNKNLPGDTTVSWLPFYHDMGLIGSLLTSFFNYVELKIMTPIQFIRSPLQWLECLGTGGTFSVSPSFGYSYTASKVKPEQIQHLDFSTWRVAMLGAERIEPTGLLKFLKLVEPCGFAPEKFAATYGLAESTLAVTGSGISNLVKLVSLESKILNEGEPIKLAEETVLNSQTDTNRSWVAGCGIAMQDLHVDIVDEFGNTLPELYPGQIRVSGNSIADGYRQFTGSANQHSLTDFIDQKLYTGDSGFIYQDQLFVLGRIGDSAKIRGQKLHAEDIDASIGLIRDIRPGKYVSLLGSVDNIDVLIIILELEDDSISWLPELRKTIRSIISDQIPYAIFRGPKGVIERTSSGKPRRKTLWKNLLNNNLPVSLIETNWEQTSEMECPLYINNSKGE